MIIRSLLNNIFWGVETLVEMIIATRIVKAIFKLHESINSIKEKKVGLVDSLNKALEVSRSRNDTGTEI